MGDLHKSLALHHKLAPKGFMVQRLGSTRTGTDGLTTRRTTGGFKLAAGRYSRVREGYFLVSQDVGSGPTSAGTEGLTA